MGNEDLKKPPSQKALVSFVFFLYLKYKFYYFYGLYDRDGVLRFANSDREACLDYAKLFELNSAHCCLMNLVVSIEKEANINLDLNQEENNN